MVRRWTVNCLCALSALVFVLAMLLWARSYFVTADFERFRRYTEPTDPPLTRTLAYGIGWGPGMLGVFHYHGESANPVDTADTWIYRTFQPDRNLLSAASPDDRINFRMGRFQLLHRIESSPKHWLSVRLIVVPLWSFALMAIPPVARLMCWRHRRARAQRNSTSVNRRVSCEAE